MNKQDLIYPELSYAIMGVSFDVYNTLGNKYQEKHYQRAFEIKMKELGIPYEKEVLIKVTFENQELGKFFADFIIDNKILIEFKRIPIIGRDEIKQVLRYLKSTNLKLGIIINFGQRNNLEYRRVINSRVLANLVLA